MPRAAVRWRVFRFKDATARNREGAEPCALAGPVGSPFEGRRIDWIPVKDCPPDWNFVLAHWGSGTYRLQFGLEQGAKGSLGFSAPVTFDDPAHPPLPAYRGAVAAAPAPANGAAPPGSGPTILDAIMSKSEGGKIDASLVVLLFQMQQVQIQQQREWYATREEDERRRRVELEDEHQRRLQARTQEFEQERQRAADFWSNESKRAIARMQELQEAAGGGSEDDRFGDLAESIQDLAEKVESRGQSDKEFWQSMVKEYAPFVIARFGGAAPAMGPGGGNGGGS